MDAQTFFYVVGGALVLLALLISAIGIRSESFPSTGMMRLGVLVVALVVAATAAGAVRSAQDEQDNREAENREAAIELEEQTAQNEEAAGGGSASGSQQEDPPSGGTGQGDDSTATGNGAEVFATNGCGSCHTLADAGGEAVGQIGPNLDEALIDRDEDFIRTSIVDPSAFIEEGYSDGIMPQTYEEEISPKDLDSLVSYLAEATGAGASGQGSGSGG